MGDHAHGLSVVDVLCDLVPDADVTMYRAVDMESLHDAINEARDADNNGANKENIIVITLDLGASSAAGDGLGHGVKNPYTEITNAKNVGIVVIAAAGNNEGRSETIEVNMGANSSATTINVDVTAGDIIHFGWNDFGGGGLATINFNLVGGGSTSSGTPGATIEVLPAHCAVGAPCTMDLTINPTSGSTSTIVQMQIIPCDDCWRDRRKSL